MSNVVIEISNLSKNYGNFKAVDSINLEVHKGDVFGFLGPNGAGKSTTIRMMLSLIKPDSGEIQYFGQNFFTNRMSILSRVGAIVEKPDFYLYLSAYKNLEILCKLSKVAPTRLLIEETLDRVGLLARAKSKVKTFSHGMKQRLGIAQALIHNPDIIILDEPTTGLDPQGIKDIRELIVQLSQQQGKTIFHSSHLLSEVELTCNKMAIMYQGKILQQGLVHNLLKADKLNVVFEVGNSQQALEVLHEQWPIQILSANTFQINGLNNIEIGHVNAKLNEHNCMVYAIIPKRSLEEYFLNLTHQ
jgi:ABC-type multidrug transport system ATPase subunit